MGSATASLLPAPSTSRPHRAVAVPHRAIDKRPTTRRPSAVPSNTTRSAPTLDQVLESTGQPLPTGIRAFFEPRFGADFSDVRLHTDSPAAASADLIGAEAYTLGNHIVLGSDQTTATPHASSLLAHELTHVVQQRSITPRIQRSMKKGCIAPSFVVDFATASAFGTVAETLVEIDYLTNMGGKPFADVFLDNPLGPMSYIAFLASHHPSIDKTLLALQVGFSGGVLVPDILDTRSPEFYDVKPDSPDGRVAGRAKLAAIDAFMAFNKLPYSRGVAYTPTPSIPIPLSGAALTAALTTIGGPTLAIPALACGLPIVTLAPRRSAAGLLVYEICVEADLDCYLKVVALEALIAAVIIAAIATGGFSIPETAPALIPAAAPLL